MASLAWVWTLVLHRVIWGVAQNQTFTSHWGFGECWWIIPNGLYKAAGGGSFSFSSCLFIISVGPVFSLEPCWSQKWCLPDGVSSSHEGRAGYLHSPYEILQQILKTSKSFNVCLQTIQDCKTLINKTWKCSHHILSFKFRVPLWNMDLQKHKNGTEVCSRRCTADAVSGGRVLLLWFVLQLLLLTRQTLF